MSAIDVSQVRDNQNVLMELNRKQVCLLSYPKEKSLLRNKFVVGYIYSVFQQRVSIRDLNLKHCLLIPVS